MIRITLCLLLLVACSPSPEVTGVLEDAPQSTVREFNVIAKQFEFVPSRIEVNEGDVVILRLTSADVSHGLFISGYNVNSPITPGKESVLKFTADKKGEFAFSCSVPCGKDHKKMEGVLVVR